MEMLFSDAKTSSLRLSAGPLARNYCLALSTALLSLVAFSCVLASGLSCSFLSVSLNNPNAIIDLNITNVPAEDQWYYNKLMSENNNALSVGILCQGDLDWLAPNTSDNSMRLLSKVFLIVTLVLGGLLLMVTCGISTFFQTSTFVWDGISYIAAGLFVCEMPIFFLLDSPPCSNSKGMFSCQLGPGSYSLIVSMVCSLSLAILTQWKNPPDWKEEYEIWNLRRRNEQMNQQSGMLFGGSKTPEEDSNDYEDEEMAIVNQQMNHQQEHNVSSVNRKLYQQQQQDLQDQPEEIGVEIHVVEKVPSPKRNSRAIDQEENPLMSNPTNPPSLSHSHVASVPTEVYGSGHGRNGMKEPSSPECLFRAHGLRPVSPLSTCTGLSASPMDRTSPATSPTEYESSTANRTSPATSPTEYESITANDTSNITDKATFMVNENMCMEEREDFFAKTPAKMKPLDDVSVQSASKQSVMSKQSIVSMMRDKLWKSSNDGQILGSVLGGDKEEVQEGWMVEDVSVGNSAELFFDDKTPPQSVKPQAHLSTDLALSQQAPQTPEPPAIERDIEADIAGLLVPGMISQMKQQIANKPVVSPERARDPEIDMYPSESSVSEEQTCSAHLEPPYQLPK